MNYQPLFDFLASTYDAIPTEGEMNEILQLCREMDNPQGNSVSLTDEEVARVKHFTT